MVAEATPAKKEETTMTKPRTTRTCPLPPLTLARQIGGTLYVVSGEFSPTATEVAGQKIKRLLLKEIEDKKPESIDVAGFL